MKIDLNNTELSVRFASTSPLETDHLDKNALKVADLLKGLREDTTYDLDVSVVENKPHIQQSWTKYCGSDSCCATCDQSCGCHTDGCHTYGCK